MDWTPVLSGHRYCSPSCGIGCSKAAFDQATSEAEALAVRMGKGWEARVWENWGWNYEVTRGAASITPSRRMPHDEDGKHLGSGSIEGGWKIAGYRCCLDASHIRPQVIEDASTPEDALGFAIQRARTNIQTATAAIDSIHGEAA